MTRREELEERVEKLASRFERIGEYQAKYEIVEALLKVEREVWKKNERVARDTAFLMGNDKWRERNALLEHADWCLAKQQEAL